MPGSSYDMNSIIKTLFSYFSLFVCFRTLRPRTVGRRRVVSRRFNSFSTIAANHWIPSDRNPNVDRRSVRATKLSDARRNAFRSHDRPGRFAYILFDVHGWRYCVNSWTGQTQFTRFTLNDHREWIIPSACACWVKRECSLRRVIANPPSNATRFAEINGLLKNINTRDT